MSDEIKKKIKESSQLKNQSDSKVATKKYSLFRGGNSRQSLEVKIAKDNNTSPEKDLFYDEGTIYYSASDPKDKPEYGMTTEDSYATKVNSGGSVTGNSLIKNNFEKINESTGEKNNQQVYKPAQDAHVANAEFKNKNSVIRTQLNKSVTERIDSPYLDTGDDNIINFEERTRASNIKDIPLPSDGVSELDGKFYNTRPETSAATRKLEQFKKNFSDALRRNGITENGMLNDTKKLETINLLASVDVGASEEEIIKYLDTLNKDEKFVENSSNKYETRYDNNKFSRKSMGFPQYGNLREGKKDKTNSVYEIDTSDNADINVNKQEVEYDKTDYVPMTLHDLVNNKKLPFKCLINSLSDQSDAQWNSVKYLGRADNVQVYSGFTRTVSIDFTVEAENSIEDLHSMWYRLNYLVGMTKPADYTDRYNQGRDDKSAINANTFVIPPFIKFNLGQMYKEQPCVITSVALNIPQEASWELLRDKATRTGNEYTYLNEAIRVDDVLVGNYPSMVTVSLSMTFLEKRKPKTKNRHFGHYSSEDGKDYDKGADRALGFNYNLIYPDPKYKNEPDRGVVPFILRDDGTLEFTGGDVFKGKEAPVAPAHPPSEFVCVNGKEKRKDTETIERELREWEASVCDCMAEAIGAPAAPAGVIIDGNLQRVDNFCEFDPVTGCLTKVNSVEVPLELECAFSKGNTMGKDGDPLIKKPPQCPSPVLEQNEFDDEDRLVGFEESDIINEEAIVENVNRVEEPILYERTLTINKIGKTRYDELLERNQKYWISDLSDYISNQMKINGWNVRQIGSEFSYVVDETNVGYTKAVSKHGSIEFVFDESGHPFSYDDILLDDAFATSELSRTEFKVICTDEELEKQTEDDLRDIAGNFQPKIYMDLNKDFEIVIDEAKGHIINRENHGNGELIQKWLAEWTLNQMTTIINPDGKSQLNYEPNMDEFYKEVRQRLSNVNNGMRLNEVNEIAGDPDKIETPYNELLVWMYQIHQQDKTDSNYDDFREIYTPFIFESTTTWKGDEKILKGRGWEDYDNFLNQLES